MHAKVLELVGWVREGFAIEAVEDAAQGGIRIRLHRGRESRALRFEHFEVPAILHECNKVGVAK